MTLSSRSSVLSGSDSSLVLSFWLAEIPSATHPDPTESMWTLRYLLLLSLLKQLVTPSSTEADYRCLHRAGPL